MQYRLGFIVSLALHASLLVFFSFDYQPKSKVYVAKKPKKEIINAVSIDSQQVLAEVNRLKEKKAKRQAAEQKRKQQLELQAKRARKQRLAEQRRIARLKREAQQLEQKRKREALKEKRRLAALKEKRIQQQRELKALEAQKAREQQQLAELKKKQAEEALAKKREQEAKRQQELEAKRLAAEKAAKARQAQIMAEVNKYKALIINSISQNWILPDNVDKSLSSRFEIRLAPGGSVLSVKLLRSSGDAVLDRSAQTAIYRASPLPVPSSPESFAKFRVVTLTVKPETILESS